MNIIGLLKLNTSIFASDLMKLWTGFLIYIIKKKGGLKLPGLITDADTFYLD